VSPTKSRSRCTFLCAPRFSQRLCDFRFSGLSILVAHSLCPVLTIRDRCSTFEIRIDRGIIERRHRTVEQCFNQSRIQSIWASIWHPGPLQIILVLSQNSCKGCTAETNACINKIRSELSYEKKARLKVPNEVKCSLTQNPLCGDEHMKKCCSWVEAVTFHVLSPQNAGQITTSHAARQHKATSFWEFWATPIRWIRACKSKLLASACASNDRSLSHGSWENIKICDFVTEVLDVEVGERVNLAELRMMQGGTINDGFHHRTSWVGYGNWNCVMLLQSNLSTPLLRLEWDRMKRPTGLILPPKIRTIHLTFTWQSFYTFSTPGRWLLLHHFIIYNHLDFARHSPTS
jgi:hypothetical protein